VPVFGVFEPAHASTLEEAEAALAAGQQEVTDAVDARDAAQLVVESELSAVEIAMAERDEAQIAYDNSETTSTSVVSSGVSVSAYLSITRSPDPSWLCSSFTSSDIAFQWSSGGISGCQTDRFSVNFTGSITIPQSGYYRFLGDADDGFYMDLNGINIINDWYDKGGWGSWSVPEYFEANTTHSFDAWYYENGGGAAVTLRYYFEESKDVFSEGIVPASWFSETTTTTTKDEDLFAHLNQKEATLSVAINDLEYARIALQDSELRLSNAIDAIPALVDAVEAFYIIYEPTNLVAVTNDDGSISLTWDAAYEDLVPVERYAVFWILQDVGGWAIASTTNSAVISSQLFEGTGGLDVSYEFQIRSDNDSLSKYSAWSNVVTASPSIYVAPEPTPSPEPEPVVTEEPQPTPEPEPTQTPEPQPSPTETAPVVEPPVEPSPEPVQTKPAPWPAPQPAPQPEVVEPVQPEPSQEPEPVASETPKPEPLETPTPAPEPSAKPAPTQTPTPKPTVTQTPTPSPSPAVTEQPKPSPSPTPTIIPEPTPVPSEKEVVEEKINTVLTEISQEPEMTTETKAAILDQKEELVAATNVVFESASKDSEEYKEALQVLAIIAQADDAELPEELAAIPVIGAVAGEVLNAFNDLGNVGADMSPEQRERSEETVVAAVIVGQVAQLATATAASAGMSAAAASTRRIR
jgi:hypothetical protein